MEEKRDIERFAVEKRVLAGFLESKKLCSIIANMVWAVFSAHEVETCAISKLSSCISSGLTTDEIWKFQFQLNTLLHLFLHQLLWYGSRRAVDDLQPKRKLVQQIFALKFFLFFFHCRKNKFHLLAIRDLLSTIIRWNRFVEQHRSELSIHDLLTNHPVDGVANVPRVYAFVVEQTFKATSSLIESRPDSTQQLVQMAPSGEG